MLLLNVNLRELIPAKLLAQSKTLPEGAPNVMIVYGYRYSPTDPECDPHTHIFCVGD